MAFEIPEEFYALYNQVFNDSNEKLIRLSGYQGGLANETDFDSAMQYLVDNGYQIMILSCMTPLDELYMLFKGEQFISGFRIAPNYTDSTVGTVEITEEAYEQRYKAFLTDSVAIEDMPVIDENSIN